MKEKKEILNITNLTKYFPGVKALDNVDFNLYENEIHCLVGENGAGKSTFIKILSGSLVPDNGNINILGEDFKFLTPLKAIELGIQTVYQESLLVPTLSVAENIYLGFEKTNNYHLVDLKKAFSESENLLKTLDIKINPKKLVEDLTIAERQLIGIMKALSRKAKILILDEPTSSLSSIEIERLLNLIKEIKRSNVGVIYISHHLEEVFKIGDRITVLKDGKKVSTHDNINLNQNDLIREMVGREASLFYSRGEIHNDHKKSLLEVKNFKKHNTVNNISFDTKSGELFGIGGMVGSGKTELARMMFGVDKKELGEIYLDGKNITPNSPLEAVQNGICLISEDRQKDGVILCRSIRENISIAKVNISPRFFLDLRKELLEVKKFFDSLKIVAPSIDVEVINLSGGNQQKVVLAKWLFTNCRIFIFDEPTRGIDIGAKQEIYKIMTDLLRENKIIIMISADIPELISMSDRIGIMRKGRMVVVLDNKDKDISEEKILTYSIGIN